MEAKNLKIVNNLNTIIIVLKYLKGDLIFMTNHRYTVSEKFFLDKNNELLINKFINCLMNHGKKSIAKNLLYRSLNNLKINYNENSIQIFIKAISNVKPALEMKSVRIAGSTYQIPVEISTDRQETMAIRWIIEGAKKQSKKKMIDKLALELWNASKCEGYSVKKKEELYKMAESNRAFAHFRW